MGNSQRKVTFAEHEGDGELEEKLYETGNCYETKLLNNDRVISALHGTNADQKNRINNQLRQISSLKMDSRHSTAAAKHRQNKLEKESILKSEEIERQNLKIKAQAKQLTQQQAAIKRLKTANDEEYWRITDSYAAREIEHRKEMEELEKNFKSLQNSFNIYQNLYDTKSKEFDSLKQAQAAGIKNYQQLKEKYKTMIDQLNEQTNLNGEEVKEESEPKKKRSRNRNRNRKRKKPEVNEKEDAISTIKPYADPSKTEKVNQVGICFGNN